MKNVASLASAAVLATAVLFACSSENSAESSSGSSGTSAKDSGSFERDGSTYDSTPSPDSGLGEMLFRPDAIYTGYDGTHTFVAPIAVYDADSDLAVTASDPSAVTIAPTKLKNPVNADGITDNGKYYLVTAKKAGTFTLTAKSKGRTTTAKVTIASYAADRWQTGKTRYEAPGTDASQPCTNCHVNGQAIDHSPATMASADDQSVGVIITQGIKPPAIPITGVTGGHKWDVADAKELDGLVTFLRALEPRGFQ